jgi:hypothetical protein
MGVHAEQRGRKMCEVCGSPFGKVKRVVGELLDLAEKGTMTTERSARSTTKS